MLNHRKPVPVRGAIVCLALASLVWTGGCGRQSNNAASTASPAPTASASPTPTAAPSSKPTPAPTPTPAATPNDPLLGRIAKLSLDEKIGQLVLIGLEGTTMQAHAKEMMDTYHVTGFILYKDNVASGAQTEALLNQLKAQNRSNAFPLWLSVDQEGGRVDRFPADYVKIPPMKSIGQTNKPDYSYKIGQALGEEVHSVGFNMDFAPDMDINSNPNNPVIGDRSFGATAQTVITHGLQVMKGIQSKRVAPVVKHFPGHGDTSVDSHLDLPVINKSLDELRSFELKPFAEAIKQQVDAVMVGHLLLPKIDGNNPASMSPALINNLLRKEMNFQGVVITDDMTMGGVTKYAEIGQASVKAVLAGSDILLVGHDYEMQKAVLQALKKAVQSGSISEKRLEESVYRIAKLKEKYGLQDTQTAHVDVKSVNQVMQSALDAGKK